MLIGSLLWDAQYMFFSVAGTDADILWSCFRVKNTQLDGILRSNIDVHSWLHICKLLLE